jgi:hypothetical protein
MTIELKIPDSIPLDPRVTVAFKGFLQAVVNRRCVGALRYGDTPQKRQRYMSRLFKEAACYNREGNFEQLLNIAVYCFLESEAPENPRFHFDPTAASATRAEFGV